jgi:hypothetical protein
MNYKNKYIKYNKKILQLNNINNQQGGNNNEFKENCQKVKIYDITETFQKRIT